MSVAPPTELAEQARVSDGSALSALAGSGGDLLNQQAKIDVPRTTSEDVARYNLPDTKLFDFSESPEGRQC